MTEAVAQRENSNRRSPYLYFALVVAALLYCLPLFSNLTNYGRNDWDQLSFRYETPRLALFRDHQLPLWNPYVNGGNVLLAHPASPVPSPWYGVVAALGAPLGLRVQVVLFMILGAVGMAALLRHWRVPAPGAFVGAVIFIMSAHFALQIAEGHLEWCVLGLMPWLMLCLLRFPDDLRYVSIAGLLLASVLTFGSVYIVAVYVAFLSVWALLEAIRLRSWRLPMGWAVTLMLTVLLSAVKLLPQLDFVRENPREITAEGFSPLGLVHVFLDPRQATLNEATHYVWELPRRKSEAKSGVDVGITPSAYAVSEAEAVSLNDRLGALGIDWNWHEYGGYITYLGLALAVLGLAVSWQVQWPLYVSGLLALIVILGNGSIVDLWALLQKLPLFEQLHVPSRFMAALVFVLAVAAGYGLGWLCRGTEQSDKRALVVLIRYGLPFAIYLELATLGWALFGNVFIGKPVKLPPHADFAQRYETIASRDPRLRGYLYPLLASNSGVLQGYENLEVKRGEVRIIGDPAYRGEVYLRNAGGSASIKEWTMGRVTVSLDLDRSDHLVMNQNYTPGWRVVIRGTGAPRNHQAKKDESGLLCIPVGPGDREVEFYYWPKYLSASIAISLAVLIACLTFLVAWGFPGWRRRSSAVSGQPG